MPRYISIPAPPRGATFRRCSPAPRQYNFNSRPSARGDGSSYSNIGVSGTYISIPAPPRGATGRGRPPREPSHFNSRPSARGDDLVVLFGLPPVHFNSRPSARGDLQGGRKSRLMGRYFNSRPSARGDLTVTTSPGSSPIFQFPPLREGRQQIERITIWQHHFNSRPSARGDGVSLLAVATYSGFQFPPLREGRGKRYAISANLLFNPYKSAWLNHSATQFVEIILVIFHRIIA